MNRVNYLIEQQKVEYKVWSFWSEFYGFFYLMISLDVVMLLPVNSYSKGHKYNTYL